MLSEVVGTKRVDFTDDTGRRMAGYTVYVTHEEQDVVGMAAEKARFLSDVTINNALGGYIPSKGDLVNCEFNRRGQLEVKGPAS